MALTTPIGKKAAKPARGNQPVKRDINLISNKEAQDRIARRGGYILLTLLIGGIVAYVAFAMPLMKQADLERSAANAKNQTIGLQGNAVEFEKLVAQRDSLNALSQYLDAQVVGDSDSSAVTDMLESACPQNVTLRNLMLNIDYLTLSGFAKSDADVAQLIVNLKNSGIFSDVRVNSVMQALDSNGAPATGDQVRTFTLTGVFPHALITVTSTPEATPAPTATASAAAQGGAGK